MVRNQLIILISLGSTHFNLAVKNQIILNLGGKKLLYKFHKKLQASDFVVIAIRLGKNGH